MAKRPPRGQGKYEVYRTIPGDPAGDNSDPQRVQADPDTFFVLRRTDVFAAQALFGYAHLVQSALEIDMLPGRTSSFTPEETDRLRKLADHVFELAVQWSRQATKLPD